MDLIYLWIFKENIPQTFLPYTLMGKRHNFNIILRNLSELNIDNVLRNKYISEMEDKSGLEFL